MSAYELDTVLKKWERGDLSAEQAIGQVLQLLQELSARVGQLERKVTGDGRTPTKLSTPSTGK